MTLPNVLWVQAAVIALCIAFGSIIAALIARRVLWRHMSQWQDERAQFEKRIAAVEDRLLQVEEALSQHKQMIEVLFEMLYPEYSTFTPEEREAFIVLGRRAENPAVGSVARSLLNAADAFYASRKHKQLAVIRSNA